MTAAPLLINFCCKIWLFAEYDRSYDLWYQLLINLIRLLYVYVLSVLDDADCRLFVDFALFVPCHSGTGESVI